MSSQSHNAIEVKNTNVQFFGYLIVVGIVCLTAFTGGFSKIQNWGQGLSVAAVVFALFFGWKVYSSDAYTNGKKHPKTHASIALLFILALAITFLYNTSVSGQSLSFIWMAYSMGILGAAFGVLGRVDVASPEANAVLNDFGDIKSYDSDSKFISLKTYSQLIDEKAEEDTSTSESGNNSTKGDHVNTHKKNVPVIGEVKINQSAATRFHSQLVQRIYISVGIGGFLGVMGLIFCHGFVDFFQLIKLKALLPSFTTGDGSLHAFLQIRPETSLDYSKAIFWCFLFGYSERLFRSILSRVEERAEDIFHGH